MTTVKQWQQRNKTNKPVCLHLYIIPLTDKEQHYCTIGLISREDFDRLVKILTLKDHPIANNRYLSKIQHCLNIEHVDWGHNKDS